VALLGDLIKLVQGELDALQRRKVIALITMETTTTLTLTLTPTLTLTLTLTLALTLTKVMNLITMETHSRDINLGMIAAGFDSKEP
jgi:hypothetical protein